MLAVIVAIAAAAGASAYLTKQSITSSLNENIQKDKAKHVKTASNANEMPWKNGQQQPVQQAQQPCNDQNVLGLAAGAIAGGVAGNQVGKGSGKTVATIGGAAGGAYLGQQYIPLKNVACR